MQTKKGAGIYTFQEHNVRGNRSSVFEGETAKFRFTYRTTTVTLDDTRKVIEEEKRKKVSSGTTESFKNKFKVQVLKSDNYEMQQEIDSMQRKKSYSGAPDDDQVFNFQKVTN